MRSDEISTRIEQEMIRNSPISVALQDLLNAIHGRLPYGLPEYRNHRNRVWRMSERPSIDNSEINDKMLSEKCISVVKLLNNNCVYKDVVPLRFDIYKSDGGDFSFAYPIENILQNDDFVYRYFTYY